MVAIKPVEILDTFCGAGGSSTGAALAIEELGMRPILTCVNHNPRAIQTHEVNHPGARHFCTGVDDLNFTVMYGGTVLDILWSSPSCTQHSNAKGGTPINEQDRATGWSVVNIASALLPPVILCENVRQWLKWGPCIRKWSKKKNCWLFFPDKKRLGETFRAWAAALRSLGYKVEWRVLCCADYGDPTTRERLFVQCVLGKRKTVWPDATHASPSVMAKFKTDLFAPSCTILPWVTGHDIIDWSLPISSIFTRKKALVAKTIRRILLGLDRFGLRELTLGGSVLQGHSYLVHQMGQSVAQEVTAPISAITGGPKHYLTIPVLTKLDADTNLPPCLLSPDPMIRCIVEDVMDSIAPSNFQFHHEWHSSGRPIIVIEGVRYVLEILFRMLQVPELSAGQGFPRDYQFKGTQTEVIKQIGNAVPCNTARALVKAVLTQNSNVGLPSCDRRALNSGGEIQPH